MRILSQVRHPNLVLFYDGGRAGSIDYIAMELIDGTSLAGAMRDGPLPWQRALEIGAGVAAALATPAGAALFETADLARCRAALRARDLAIWPLVRATR